MSAWGNNTYGQTNVPAAATNITAIAAAANHTAMVHWHEPNRHRHLPAGDSFYYQTNNPPGQAKAVAIGAGPAKTLVLLSDGSVVEKGLKTNSFASVHGIVELLGWPTEDFALTADGTVVGSGYPAITIPNAATNIIALSGETNCVLALTASGQLVSWGTVAGMTNVPPAATNVIGMAVGFDHCLAIIGNGTPPSFIAGITYTSKIGFGSRLPLAARATGDQPLTYEWLQDGLPLAGITNAFPELLAGAPPGIVSYQALVSNQYGSATSVVANIDIQPINVFGNIADGQTYVPDSATNCIDVAAGGFHSLFLNPDGTIGGWGKNTDGQVNIPSVATNVVAIAAGGDHSLALNQDGSILAWGRDWDGQTDVPAVATNVIAVSAGWAHSLALRGDGTVVAWGNDDFGQTDVPALALRIVAVAAGRFHSMALRSDGTVVTWGLDSAVPSEATNVVAIATGFENCIALRADGSVVAWGDNSYGQSSVPASATNIVLIAANYYHAIALRADGSAVTWGSDYFGVSELPPAATNNIGSIAAGEDYTVLLASRSKPVFGRQLTGVSVATGAPAVLSATVQGTFPMSLQWLHDGVAVPGATNLFFSVANANASDAGLYTLVATGPSGSSTNDPILLTVAGPAVTTAFVGGFGANGYGQTVPPPTLQNPRAISAGHFHSMALNEDGTVVAWGKNVDGQSTVPASATNAVAIAAGGDHCLALRNDGSVVAWGRDWDGQTDVPSSAAQVTAIAAGSAHSMALQSDGTVICWGNDDWTQTEVPANATNITSIAAGYYHSLALRADGKVIAWGLLDTVPSTLNQVVGIAAGWWHSLALDADGHVVAWGDNSYGQCDVPPDATNVVAISAGYFHSLALRSDGTVLAWGAGFQGATTVPSGLADVTAMAAGEGFSLVLVQLGPPRSFDVPRSLTGHAGGSINLTTTVQGESPVSFQWFHDGAAVTGSSSPFLTLSNLTAADAGTYFLVTSNAAGTVTNSSVTISVDLAPYIADLPGFQNVLVGQSFCLAPQVLGAEPISYRWQTNGVDSQDSIRLNGSSSSQLCLQKAQGTDSGFYSLIVSNTYGTITQLVAEVSVTEVIGWGDDGAHQIEPPIGTTNILSVAAGGDHSLALRRDGTILAWGDNSFGQSSPPPEATNIVGVGAGVNHSVALRADGTVLAWGDDSFGQTNVPVFSTNVTAIAAGGDHSVALLADGSYAIWGKKPTPFSPPTNAAVAAAAGGDQTLVLFNDGTVLETDSSYLGFAKSLSNVVAIAEGQNHALVLRRDGSVIAWGNNYYGQASVPSQVTNAVAIAAGDNQSVALLSNGSLVAWGQSQFGQDSPPAIQHAVAAAIGGAHSLALVETAASAPAPVFQLVAPSLTISNGTFRLRLSHLFGSGPLTISVSSNLQDWQPIYTNAPTSGDLDFVDPFPSSAEQRFYRAVEQR